MNSHAETSTAGITLDTIGDWLRNRADGLYGGEVITQLQHALQCATLAQAEGASLALVTAALLHDIGHLADNGNDLSHPHGELAAYLLGGMFGLAVTEPIRLHIDAKRYLCVMDPLYWSGLSNASKRSLEWQGGPYTPSEAAEFISLAYADDAVRLRRWDDAAKVPGAATPSLDYFIEIARTVCAVPEVSEAA
jgi:phosphonate degradation associated HDIG domain protein